MGEIYILGKLLFQIRGKCARNVNRRSETKRNQNVNTARFYIDTLYSTICLLDAVQQPWKIDTRLQSSKTLY